MDRTTGLSRGQDPGTAIRDFVAFEAATSTTYPWAMPPEAILSDELLSRVAARVKPGPGGGYDTDGIYDAVDAVAGVNPTLLQ